MTIKLSDGCIRPDISQNNPLIFGSCSHYVVVEVDCPDTSQMVIVSTYNFLFLDIEKFNKAILITNGQSFKSPLNAADASFCNFFSLVAFSTPNIGNVS